MGRLWVRKAEHSCEGPQRHAPFDEKPQQQAIFVAQPGHGVGKALVSLAAQGRSNREIAHELYVTLKTVEGHLSRAYTKLGIEGRAALPEILDEKSRVPTL